MFMDAPFNRHGGLTLVPMPGFMPLALRAKARIEQIGSDERKATPIDVVAPEFGERASGEPFLRLKKDHVGGHDCAVIASGPGTVQMLMRLCLLLRYLVGRRAGRIALVCGYFPLGRSDKDEGSLEFALPPLIVDLIKTAGDGKIDRIISADLHASQIVMAGNTGFITEISLLGMILKHAITELRKSYDRVCLVFPDDGARKRAEATVAAVQRKLGLDLPTVYGAKRRASSSDVSVLGLYGDTAALEGAAGILLDDEIATGSTNLKLARILKDKPYASPCVWAVATHGVLCGNAPTALAEATCPIDRVVTTDTIALGDRQDLARLVGNRLEILSWAEELGRVIYHHHWDESIREIR
jgi:phosphoribosylpyrophosphate synthetase